MIAAHTLLAGNAVSDLAEVSGEVPLKIVSTVLGSVLIILIVRLLITRMVSMNGVNGWYCANHCNPTGIDSVGTKPLPRKGSSMSNSGRLLAVSTDFVCIPIAFAITWLAVAMG